MDPYLTEANTARPHETIYWRFGKQWAVRRHDLELVVSKGGSGKPELYDLAADLSESSDLADQRPETVKELQTLWDTWSAEQAQPRLPAEKGKGQSQEEAAASRFGGCAALRR